MQEGNVNPSLLVHDATFSPLFYCVCVCACASRRGCRVVLRNHAGSLHLQQSLQRLSGSKQTGGKTFGPDPVIISSILRTSMKVFSLLGPGHVSIRSVQYLFCTLVMVLLKGFCQQFRQMAFVFGATHLKILMFGTSHCKEILMSITVSVQDRKIKTAPEKCSGKLVLPSTRVMESVLVSFLVVVQQIQRNQPADVVKVAGRLSTPAAALFRLRLLKIPASVSRSISPRVQLARRPVTV